MVTNNNTYKLMSALKLVSVFFADIILLFTTVYLILAFFDIFPLMSSKNITILSLGYIFLLLYVFFRTEDKHGMSASLLAYLILTQFGMSTLYYVFGPESLSSFSSITLRFLNSNLYNKAIILGMVASISYVLGARFASMFKSRKKGSVSSKNNLENDLVYYTGILFLFFTFLYLAFFTLSGRIRLGMSYHAYLNSGIVNSFYSWLLLIYSLGICFTVSVAEKAKLRLAVVLFSISALILFSTGNRGEVLYATLAALGIVYYKNEKLKFKYVFFAIGLVFVIIPFIRTTRHVGTINAFDLLTINIFDAVAEMGHQLRLSVLILEEFAFGTREFLYGFSYYNPIINIIDNFIPGSIRLNQPLDFNFDSAFSGLGFSQVAESYANFGLLGVITYHFIISFLLRKAELKNLRGLKLAYWGGVLAILINATRNRFAFVIGQVFILTMIYLVLKVLSNKRIIIRKGN